MAAVPENRKLAKKEADQFKAAVKFYETKQYKKAIKAADQVLKKYPNHGETLAMKGLTLNSLDKKEEAYEHVRNGLKNDVRSHVCWHVFGLLHRSDRNYHEAIKCYLNALRIDNNNLQILRDLSFLQIQMRDLKGFLETRRQVLVLKSNNKQHWIAYAVANYLVNDFEKAVNVIDSFTETVDGGNAGTGYPLYEDSELNLFKFQCLKERGSYDQALHHLLTCRDQVKDVLTWREGEASVLLLLQRWDDAHRAYSELIDTNTENYRYHVGLQSAVLHLETQIVEEMLDLKACDLPCTVLNILPEQRERLRTTYDVLKSKHKKSTACTRIVLAFEEGDYFRSALHLYICTHVRKGVPSLGSDLDALYTVAHPVQEHRRVRATDPYDIRNHPTANLVLELIQQSEEVLISTHSLPLTPGASHPSDILWLRFLQAYVLEAMGRYEEALEAIDKCIVHTPTAVDMYMKKGRILKRSGDVQAAASIVNGARKLDLSDRYINNKATKYLLRAGQEQEALDTISLFTRHEGGGDPQWNLFDMQCIWYELEHADAHVRAKRWGPALKKLFGVEKHFNDFSEDQFDFHAYCIRKGTINAYTQLLKLEDNIYGHKFFQRAARAAIDIYVHLHQQPPPSRTGAAADNPDASSLTAEERKKLKNKLRKEKRKQTQNIPAEASGNSSAVDEEESKKQQNVPMGKGRGTPPADDDPQGEKLLAKPHLEEAHRFSRILESHAPSSAESQLYVFKVKILRRSFLPALRALKRAIRADPSNAYTHWALIELATEVHVAALSPDPVREVVVEALSSLLQGKSVEQYVDELSGSCAQSTCTLLLRCVSARLLIKLHGAAALTRAQNCLCVTMGNKQTRALEGRGVTVRTLKVAMDYLREEPLLCELANALEEECRERFPLANFVGGGLQTRGVSIYGPPSLEPSAQCPPVGRIEGQAELGGDGTQEEDIHNTQFEENNHTHHHTESDP